MRDYFWCCIAICVLFCACGFEASPIGDSSNHTTLRFINYSVPELSVHPSTDQRSLARFSFLADGSVTIHSIEIVTTSAKAMRTTGELELWIKGNLWATTKFVGMKATFYPAAYGTSFVISDSSLPTFDIRGQMLDGTSEDFGLWITKIEAVDEASDAGKLVVIPRQEDYTELTFPVPLTRFFMESGTLTTSLPDISPAGHITTTNTIQELLAVFRLGLYGEDAVLEGFSLQFVLSSSLLPEAVTHIQIEDYYGKIIATAPVADQLGQEMVFSSNYLLSDHFDTDIYVSAKIKGGTAGSLYVRISHIAAHGRISNLLLPTQTVSSNQLIVKSY